MLTLEDIRQMDIEEIEKNLTKNRHDLLKAKIEIHSSQSQKTSMLKALRVTVARLQTVKNELIKASTK